MARRKQRSPETKQRRERERILRRQQKDAAIRAKYGPARRASPVVVKSLETGEILAVKDDWRFRAARPVAERLEALARAAGYESYAHYLRSAHWLALRARVLTRDRYRCVRCGSKKRLQVHHDRYEALGAESLDSLKTMCGHCHERIHR